MPQLNRRDSLKYWNPFVALVFCTTLAACGGGGDPAPGMPPSTTPEPAETEFGLPNPIRLAIGATDRDSFVHFHAATRVPQPIPTQADVDEYLRTFDPGGQPRRFASPPVVRFAGGTAPERRITIRRGIHALNAFLPYNRHITVGPDMDGRGVLKGSDVPEGVIFVDAGAPRHVLNRQFGRDDIAGYASNAYASGALRSSAILIGDFIGPDAGFLYSIFTHELLHAVGFDAHPDITRFPNSRIRGYHGPEETRCPDDRTCFTLPDYGLPMIDGDALQTLYADFDGWDATVTRLEGVFDQEIAVRSPGICHADGTGTVDPSRCSVPAGEAAAFGVDWRNGLARPWVTGYTGRGGRHSLANNPALSGTVSWAGALVGFTPSREAVSGDATLRVNMSSLDGSAGFGNLRYRGSGRIWNDGELNYSVAVQGNRFHRTSGDDGDLFGRFVDDGDDFQRGAVGTLERPDLTAAFGASR